MKKIVLLLILVFVVSCSPGRHNVNMKVKKHHPPQDTNAIIVRYYNAGDIPIESEKIGIIKSSCLEYKIKCDTDKLFSLMADSVRKAGGNAMLITNHKKITRFNSFLQIDADIYNVFDFSSLPISNYYKVYKKGHLDLRLSLPYVNQFSLNTDEGIKKSIGFLGALAGADYYYKDMTYLSLFAAGGLNFWLPFPVVVDYYDGETEFISTLYCGLTNNHRFRYFSFGYGLSYSDNYYIHNFFGSYYDDYFEKYGVSPVKESSSKNLGLILNAYIVTGDYFSFGIIYRPDLYNIDTKKFHYEHLISIDFAWKIPLRKRTMYNK